METTQFGFIGGGNMAQAMARGLSRAGVTAIAVSEPNDERRRELEDELPEIEVHDDNVAVAAGSDVLVLAVKPDVVTTVCRQLAGIDVEQKTIVSIAAGVRLDTIVTALGDRGTVVRAMPNQPALLGLGMTVLFARQPLSQARRRAVERLAAAAGEFLWLDAEAMMDGATAVAGSGPAYVYLLLEMLEESARDFGFDGPAARRLAVATVRGAAHVAAEQGESPERLRERVTSPGGTTAAAIGALEQANIRGIFRTALAAGRDRGRELSLAQDDD